MKEDIIFGALKAIIIILLYGLITAIFTGCEKEEFIDESECCTPQRLKPNVSPIQQTCCDWDAVNFDPEWNGHNVNQLYFTGSDLCNNELCVYPNY